MMKVGIVGLGLIGGSLGLDLRDRGHQVFGVSQRPQTCLRAVERGVVDRAEVDFSLLGAVNVVFICTPIAAIAPTVKQLISYLSPDTILTDVASVKLPIVEAVSPLWANFVGGHPMAGTESSGIEAALPNLFAGAPYVLTPLETTPPAALQTVEDLARSLQSHVYRCDPADHDRAVAWISHLPVVVSASLIAACASETNSSVLELAQKLASSGFRDTSRVGGGNPELGLMMAQHNREKLLSSLAAYRDHFDSLMALIEQQDWQALEDKLQLTQKERSPFINSEFKIQNSK